jgi:hypothetical protein
LPLPTDSQLAAAPLSIVIFGPGFGESIVLRAATPNGAEWAVVDSARRERETGSTINPALKLLEDCNASPSLVVLTHPHQDHAGGMAHLVERAPDGATVGCVEPLMSPPGPLSTRRDPDDRRAERRTQVRNAHIAISQAWEGRAHKWALVADAQPFSFASWLVSVLNPGAPELADAVAKLTAGKKVRLNDLSAALLLERDTIRLVLAADCERAAWVEVASRLAPNHLRATRPVKVPHHGSRGAIHDVLIDYTTPDAGRPQVVTPFPSSGALPRFEIDQGADRLLRATGELLLTALPAELLPQDDATTIDEVRNALTTENFAGDIDFAIEDAEPASTGALAAGTRDPLDTWVLLGVHLDGTVAATRGGHAVRLVP